MFLVQMSSGICLYLELRKKQEHSLLLSSALSRFKYYNTNREKKEKNRQKKQVPCTLRERDIIN